MSQRPRSKPLGQSYRSLSHGTRSYADLRSKTVPRLNSCWRDLEAMAIAVSVLDPERKTSCRGRNPYDWIKMSPMDLEIDFRRTDRSVMGL